jgi:hypothetical protein
MTSTAPTPVTKRKFLKLTVSGGACTIALAGCATLGLPKIAKASAGYDEHPRGQNHCHDCAHFDAPNSCTVVDGLISPLAVCNYFLHKL